VRARCAAARRRHGACDGRRHGRRGGHARRRTRRPQRRRLRAVRRCCHPRRSLRCWRQKQPRRRACVAITGPHSSRFRAAMRCCAGPAVVLCWVGSRRGARGARRRHGHLRCWRGRSFCRWRHANTSAWAPCHVSVAWRRRVARREQRLWDGGSQGSTASSSAVRRAFNTAVRRSAALTLRCLERRRLRAWQRAALRRVQLTLHQLW
jgi:hypothetical protein